MVDWEKVKEKSSFDNGELIQVCFADEYIKELELIMLRVADWDIPEGMDKEFLFSLHKKHFPENYT